MILSISICNKRFPLSLRPPPPPPSPPNSPCAMILSLVGGDVLPAVLHKETLPKLAITYTAGFQDEMTPAQTTNAPTCSVYSLLSPSLLSFSTLSPISPRIFLFLPFSPLVFSSPFLIPFLVSLFPPHRISSLFYSFLFIACLLCLPLLSLFICARRPHAHTRKFYPQWDADASKYYTLVMTDPGIPSTSILFRLF